MVRRVTPSQLRSQLRHLEQKQRNAINQINRAIRSHNQNVKRAVDKYNQEVRSHNTRVRSNRQKLQSALLRLESQSNSIQSKLPNLRASVQIVHQSYDLFVQNSSKRYEGTPLEYVVDLVDKEHTQNLETMASLLEDGTVEAQTEAQDSTISDELSKISADLDARWRGALFSLSPRNPDAARHFCTSAREIFTEILQSQAPDGEVLSWLPNCERTSHGKPTRRSRIQYILKRKKLNDQYLEDFVDSDLDNIIELFNDFNDGTHGRAGKFSFQQLLSIKNRVEGGIVFLCRIADQTTGYSTYSLRN